MAGFGYAMAMACTSPGFAAPMVDCYAVAEPTTVNNLAPVPMGLVNNLADEPEGTPLPEQGVVSVATNPVDINGVHTNIVWGPERWKEPTRNCKGSRQVFDFLPALPLDTAPPEAVFPTVVYFHPNGLNHHWEPGSDLDRQLAQVAHANGFHFISMEFRHPVPDQYLAGYPPGTPVPHTDVKAALLKLRSKATTMKIDVNRMYAFGHSRGTLALWQAVQGDSVGLVKAVVGYQAQTTYQCQEFADLFMVPGNATDADVAKCQQDSPYHAQFGSAISSVNSQVAVRVMLQYKDKFYLQSDAPNETRIKPITVAELKQRDRLHYPNFGMAFYNAMILKAQAGLMSRPSDLIPEERQFEGWLTFVQNLP
ncbi:MAG: alpha/beta hydrolase [Pseudomonadota bacterium]